MAKNNGHWYTDKNGNHYFVENGQSPKEGWEESKRRKMISGGKYMTSEDGNDYSEVDKDKYDAYEADEADFDENVDDDFGFDEEMEVSDEEKQEFIDQLVKDNYFQEGEIKDIKFNDDDDATIDITTDKGTKRYEYVGGRLFDHEGSNDDEYNDDEGELANNNYKAYEADIKRFTTKGQKLDLIQDIKEDDSLTQSQKNELINKIRNTQTTLNDDEQRERVSELEGDRLFNIDIEGSSQGKYKYGKDSQNRFYVDDETGYRQYFTRENEARDYADRMNAAQGAKPQFSQEQRYATYTAEDEVGLTDYKYKTKEDVDKVAKWLVDNHYAKDNSEAVELIKSEMRDPSEIDRALENSAQGSQDISQEEWNSADAAKLDQMKKDIINKYGAAEGGKIISRLNNGKNSAMKSSRNNLYEPDDGVIQIGRDKVGGFSENIRNAKTPRSLMSLGNKISREVNLGNISREDEKKLRDEIARKQNELVLGKSSGLQGGSQFSQLEGYSNSEPLDGKQYYGGSYRNVENQEYKRPQPTGTQDSRKEKYQPILKKAFNALDEQDAMNVIFSDNDVLRAFQKVSRENPNDSFWYKLSLLPDELYRG